LRTNPSTTKGDIYNFFCGLHFLVAVADHTAEALRLFEVAHCDSSPDQAKASTVQFIQTACKALQKHGDERYGQALQFASYLKQQGIQKLPLSHFKGNRFNTIFHDGAGMFYLHRYTVDFLSTVQTPNHLVQAVLADAKEEMNLVGCKALGLMNKLITTPFCSKKMQLSL